MAFVPVLSRCFGGSFSKFYSTVSDDFYLNVVMKNSQVEPKLNTIRDNPGARKKKVRIGRGTGSGRGKTSTHGHKGRKPRQGGEVAFGFEGGQTPLYKRVGKHGFDNSKFQRKYAPLNLSRLQFWIDSGRLNKDEKITMKHLVDSGCVGRLRRNQVGIKLLGEGAAFFKSKIDIEVSQASESALLGVKQNDGCIRLVHYDSVSLRALMKPIKYRPYTNRRIPYCQPPRPHINRRLVHPMEQPDQLPFYEEQDLISSSRLASEMPEWTCENGVEIHSSLANSLGSSETYDNEDVRDRLARLLGHRNVTNIVEYLRRRRETVPSRKGADAIRRDGSRTSNEGMAKKL